jgi:hypothetical protein
MDEPPVVAKWPDGHSHFHRPEKRDEPTFESELHKCEVRNCGLAKTGCRTKTTPVWRLLADMETSDFDGSPIANFSEI